MGIVEKIFKSGDTGPGASCRRGEALCRQGYYSEAVEWLDKAIAADPKNTPAWYLKGFALYQQGAFEESQQYFDQALALDPDQPDALLYKGLVSSNFGRHAPALALFDRALAIHPSFIQAWYARGLTLAVLGDYDQAVAAYETVLRLDPGHADALVGISVAKKKRGAARPAPAVTGNSTGSGPGRMPPPVATVPSPVREPLPSAAAPVRPPAQTAGPVPARESPVSRSFPAPAPAAGEPAPRRVIVHGAESRKVPPAVPPLPVPEEFTGPAPGQVPRCSTYQEQIRELEAAPDTPGDRLPVLGALYMKTGRFREAAGCLEQHLAQSPGDAGAWQALGDAQKKSGHYDDALAAYDRSLDLDAGQPLVLVNRAKTLVMLGENEAALASCDRATSLDPSCVEAWLYKGFICRKIRRDADAAAAYNRVLALSPGEDKALRELRRIKGGA